MSEMMMMAVAGAFGISLAALVATSVVALPLLAYDEARAKRRRGNQRQPH